MDYDLKTALTARPKSKFGIIKCCLMSVNFYHEYLLKEVSSMTLTNTRRNLQHIRIAQLSVALRLITAGAWEQLALNIAVLTTIFSMK